MIKAVVLHVGSLGRVRSKLWSVSSVALRLSVLALQVPCRAGSADAARRLHADVSDGVRRLLASVRGYSAAGAHVLGCVPASGLPAPEAARGGSGEAKRALSVFGTY